MSVEAKVWLQLLSLRIHPLTYVMDLAIEQAMVVACTLPRFEINMGAYILEEWRYFYDRKKLTRDIFLLSLIIEL